MPIPVRLRDVADAIDEQFEDWQAFIHRQTGELVSISDEEARLADDDEDDDPDAADCLREELPKVREVLQSDDYLPLPSQFEFHEYQVMERFSYSVREPEVQQELLRAINGRGAFRYFRDTVAARGIEEDWYAYREQALRKLAAQFLEARGIAFEDE